MPANCLRTVIRGIFAYVRPRRRLACLPLMLNPPRAVDRTPLWSLVWLQYQLDLSGLHHDEQWFIS